MTELIPGFAELFMKFGAVPVLFGYLAISQWDLKKKLAKTENKLEKYLSEDRQKGFDTLAHSSRVIEQNNKILERALISNT